MKNYKVINAKLVIIYVFLILNCDLLLANNDITELDKRLTKLEQILERNGLLELSSELNKLKEEQRVLKGNIEEIKFSLDSNKIVDQTELPQQKEKALVNLATDLTSDSSTLSIENKIENNTESNINTELTGEEMYKNSFALLKAADYENAILGFREYLLKYRNGKFADNSMFWIGEAYWVTQDFEKAIVEYVQLTDTYPQSQKSSHALLKIGYCYEKLGKIAEATAALEDLQQKFPNSTAARLGAVKLEKLKNGPN